MDQRKEETRERSPRNQQRRRNRLENRSYLEKNSKRRSKQRSKPDEQQKRPNQALQAQANLVHPPQIARPPDQVQKEASRAQKRSRVNNHRVEHKPVLRSTEEQPRKFQGLRRCLCDQKQHNLEVPKSQGRSARRWAFLVIYTTSLGDIRWKEFQRIYTQPC